MKTKRYLLFILVSSLLFSSITMCQYKDTDPIIVILTGPSCAGKSTLSKSLTKLYPELKLHVVNLGSFRYPILLSKAKELDLVAVNYESYNNILLDHEVQKNLLLLNEKEASLIKNKWKEAFEICNEQFIKYIMDLTAQNKNLILDVPIHQKDLLQLLQQKLNGKKILFALVHLPFNCLLDRLKKRNNKLEDYRYINQVIYKYFLYYKLKKYSENFLEKINFQDLENKIIKWTSENPTFTTFPTKQELIEKIKNFLNFKENKTYLIPSLKYDLVINTSTLSPKQAAKLLKNKILIQDTKKVFFDNDCTI